MKNRRRFSSILLCAVLGLSVLGLGAGVLKMSSLENSLGGLNAVVSDGLVDNENTTNVNGDNNETVVNRVPNVVVRDTLSQEELRAGEENTVIKSVKLVSGDSASFFADVVLSEEEQKWFEAGEESDMPSYGASAEDGKWSASLSLGDGAYSLMITGGVISNAINISFPDTLMGYEVTGISSFSFEGESLITGIVIPSFMSTIGEKAFAGCTGITAFSVREGTSGPTHASPPACLLLSREVCS